MYTYTYIVCNKTYRYINNHLLVTAHQVLLLLLLIVSSQRVFKITSLQRIINNYAYIIFIEGI